MTRLGAALAVIPSACWLLLLPSCAITSHDVRPEERGVASSSEAMEAALASPEAGPIQFTRVVAADWVVDRAGLINVDHPKAQAAGIENGDEAVQIYFYALVHPEHGTWLVDTGVGAALLGDPDKSAVGGILRSALNLEKMTVHLDTRTWAERHGDPVKGVLLTHMHIDHILGLPDLPKDARIVTGPDEPAQSALQNLVVQGTTDDLLEGHAPLSPLRMKPDPTKRFDAVVDFFGDGSVWVMHVPGHTPGSLAFAVRSAQGLKLLVGDSCHTRWGWYNGVEPGGFTADHEGNAKSLKALIELAKRHPTMEVHLGHQNLSGDSPLVRMPSAAHPTPRLKEIHP